MGMGRGIDKRERTDPELALAEHGSERVGHVDGDQAVRDVAHAAREMSGCGRPVIM